MHVDRPLTRADNQQITTTGQHREILISLPSDERGGHQK
jgi:hypothetical protein